MISNSVKEKSINYLEVPTWENNWVPPNKKTFKKMKNYKSIINLGYIFIHKETKMTRLW